MVVCNMGYIFNFLSVLCIIIFVSNNAFAYSINSSQYYNKGFIYSNSSFPKSVAKQNPCNKDLSTLKNGTSISRSYFSLVEVDNAGIEEAAQNAGIKKISHIDVNEKSIFIFGEKSQLPYMASNKRSYLTGSFFYFN